MRPPGKLTAVSVLFLFLCAAQSLSAAHHLTLCLVIALLIFFPPIDKRVREERVEEERKHSTNFLNPIDLLR